MFEKMIKWVTIRSGPFSFSMVFGNYVYLNQSVRRLLAIFFLSVFLFNIGGFYLAFWSIRLHAKKELLSRLDAEQYDSEALTVLSIPLSLPYPVQQSDYERVDGELE